MPVPNFDPGSQRPKRPKPRLDMVREQLDAQQAPTEFGVGDNLDAGTQRGTAAGTVQNPTQIAAPVVAREESPAGTVDTRPPPPPPPPPPPTDVDAATESFIADLITGGSSVDTSDQERLIQEQMDRVMGVGLNDARARGGAAGFAMSGQQLAAEGGIRADAARDVANRQLDLRNKEKQRAIDNALRGIGADVDLRAAGMDEWLIAQIMGLQGMPPPGAAAPSGGGDEGGSLPIAIPGVNVGTGAHDTRPTEPGQNTDDGLHAVRDGDGDGIPDAEYAYHSWPQTPGPVDAPEEGWVRVTHLDQPGVEAYADPGSNTIRFVSTG